MVPKVLKCYVESSQDGWEGICVDLDIAVQADSFDDVIRELEDAINVYFETVMGLPAEDRRRLLNRRVPLLRRARYTVPSYIAGLFKPRTARARHDIIVPPDTCPA